MDVVVACDGIGSCYEHARKALRWPNGRLVCLGIEGGGTALSWSSSDLSLERGPYGGSCWSVALECLYVQAALAATHTASYYDAFYSFENYLEEYKVNTLYMWAINAHPRGSETTEDTLTARIGSSFASPCPMFCPTFYRAANPPTLKCTRAIFNTYLTSSRRESYDRG